MIPKWKWITSFNGLRFKVSVCDYEFALKHNWLMRKAKHRKSTKPYIFRQLPRPGRGQLLFSREIMNCPKHLFVDHINGNTLDNRRSNLRICTHQENMMNQSKQMRKTTSKYKGVSWSSKTNSWRARIKIDKKEIVLGYFSNQKSAAIAYNNAAKKIFKTFSRLNIL